MNFIYNGKQLRILNHIVWQLMQRIVAIQKNGYENCKNLIKYAFVFFKKI